MFNHFHFWSSSCKKVFPRKCQNTHLNKQKYGAEIHLVHCYVQTSHPLLFQTSFYAAAQIQHTVLVWVQVFHTLWYTSSCLRYLMKLGNTCWPFVGLASVMIELVKNLARRRTRGSVMEVKLEICSKFCSPNLIYNESVLRPWDCEVHGDLEKLWFWMYHLESCKVVR